MSIIGEHLVSSGPFYCKMHGLPSRELGAPGNSPRNKKKKSKKKQEKLEGGDVFSIANNLPKQYPKQVWKQRDISFSGESIRLSRHDPKIQGTHVSVVTAELLGTG